MLEMMVLKLDFVGLGFCDPLLINGSVTFHLSKTKRYGHRACFYEAAVS